MLNLNYLDIDVKYALEEHKKYVCILVEKRLNEKINRSSQKYTSNEILKAFLNKIGRAHV